MTLYDEIKASYVPKPAASFDSSRNDILDQLYAVLKMDATNASLSGETSCSHTFSTKKTYSYTIYSKGRQKKTIHEGDIAHYLAEQLESFLKEPRLQSTLKKMLGPDVHHEIIAVSHQRLFSEDYDIRISLSWKEPKSSEKEKEEPQ